MSVYYVWCLGRPVKWIGSLGTRVTTGYETPCRCVGPKTLNQGLLKECSLIYWAVSQTPIIIFKRHLFLSLCACHMGGGAHGS